MTETTWLITGANRGLGLELTRQLLASPSNTVVATCRNPAGATDLHALKDTAKGTLHLATIDVTDEASIKGSVAAVEELLGENPSLDYLYNNAAINEAEDTALTFDPAVLLRAIQCNVIGPALLLRAYLPLLERGQKKTIVNVTSGLASIGLDLGAKATSYTISKTALNMLTYKQRTARPDLIAILIDPGWVKTEMGGSGASLEPEFSASHCLRVVRSLTAEDNGKFFRYDGSEIPW